MLKRILSILLCALMLLPLAACGGGGNTDVLTERIFWL